VGGEGGEGAERERRVTGWRVKEEELHRLMREQLAAKERELEAHIGKLAVAKVEGLQKSGGDPSSTPPGLPALWELATLDSAAAAQDGSAEGVGEGRSKKKARARDTSHKGEREKREGQGGGRGRAGGRREREKDREGRRERERGEGEGGEGQGEGGEEEGEGEGQGEERRGEGEGEELRRNPQQESRREGNFPRHSGTAAETQRAYPRSPARGRPPSSRQGRGHCEPPGECLRGASSGCRRREPHDKGRRGETSTLPREETVATLRPEVPAQHRGRRRSAHADSPIVAKKPAQPPGGARGAGGTRGRSLGGPSFGVSQSAARGGGRGGLEAGVGGGVGLRAGEGKDVSSMRSRSASEMDEQDVPSLPPTGGQRRQVGILAHR